MIRIHIGTLIIGILFLLAAYEASTIGIGWFTVSFSFVLGVLIHAIHNVMNGDND